MVTTLQILSLAANADVVEFTQNELDLPETAQEREITLQRHGDLTGPSGVQIAVQDITTHPRNDYQLSTLSIHFAPGEATRTILFHAIQDRVTEPDEELILRVFASDEATSIGMSDSLRIRIADSDRPGSVDQYFHLDAKVAHFGSISSPVVGADWITVQPDGKLLVSGGFYDLSLSNGVSLIRLNADGSLDPGFKRLPLLHGIEIAPPNRFTLLQPDGRILVATGIPMPSDELIRLHSDGTRDDSFQVTLLPSSQLPNLRAAVIQPDGRILIGGSFTHVNGMPRAGLARLESNGTLDSAFSGGKGVDLQLPDGRSLGGVVAAIAVQQDGAIWVGGRFNRFGDEPRNYLARLNPEGDLDSRIVPSIDFAIIRAIRPTVSSIVCDDRGRVLVGGQFDQVNGMAKTNLVRLKSTGEMDTLFDAKSATGCENGFFFGQVIRIAVERKGRLLVVLAPQSGLPCRNFFRIHEDGSLDDGFTDPTVSSEQAANFVYPRVRCVAVDQAGSILVGGPFTSLGLSPIKGIGRLNGGVSHFEFNQLKRQEGGGVELLFELPRGQDYQLRVSQDLENWKDLAIIPSPGSENRFTDPNAAGKPRLFYRADRIPRIE